MNDKKCKICRGTGKVPTEKRLKKYPCTLRSDCYYCRGKGYRTQNYKRDVKNE